MECGNVVMETNEALLKQVFDIAGIQGKQIEEINQIKTAISGMKNHECMNMSRLENLETNYKVLSKDVKDLSSLVIDFREKAISTNRQILMWAIGIIITTMSLSIGFYISMNNSIHAGFKEFTKELYEFKIEMKKN